MIRLQDVLDLPELGLKRVHASVTTQSPEIRWVHVSELVDPSPWLLGKELLLTTGLALEDDSAAWYSYCGRLVNAGISALGISTGPSLPYIAMPGELLAAAQHHDLTLLHVPHDTLMQNVVQHVSDALNKAANQGLVRAFSVQRQLSEAASSGQGTDRIVTVLSRVLDIQTVVLDERLRILASSSEQAKTRVYGIREELKVRLRDGLRWSISEEGHDDSLVVLPLGTGGHVSGILTCTKTGALSVHDRSALGLAASLLGILLERRQATQKHRRMVESQLLASLLTDASTLPDLELYLAQKGVEVEHVEVLCTVGLTEESSVAAFITSALEISDEVLTTRIDEMQIFAILNARKPLAEPLRELVISLGLGPAGLGDRRPLVSIVRSLAQARFARSIALSRNIPLLERVDTGGYRALMMMGPSEVRHQFADSVLSPLDEADQGGRSDLVNTARAYVTALGNHELTADALGVHRHTVRARIARIAQLTGRDLTQPDDLLELWIAVEFRASGSHYLDK